MKENKLTENEILTLKETLLSCKSYDKRIAKCVEILGESIGEGTGRCVFKLNDTYVIKIAKNDNGKEQILNELSNEERENYSFFPKINKELSDCENNWFMVCEYFPKIDFLQFKEINGISFRDHVNNVHKASIGELRKNKNLQEIYNYVYTYRPIIFDYTHISSYGVDPTTNEIKILDGGMNAELLNNLKLK